jgi:hypothetical protein
MDSFFGNEKKGLSPYPLLCDIVNFDLVFRNDLNVKVKFTDIEMPTNTNTSNTMAFKDFFATTSGIINCKDQEAIDLPKPLIPTAWVG